jgi:DNA mismatch repair protein MSH2
MNHFQSYALRHTKTIQDHSDSLAKLQEMVETTVDLEALDRHEFVIKPEFDDGLRMIRKRLDKISREMDLEFNRVAKDLGQEANKKLFLENHRVHGWCLRLTRNVRNLLPFQVLDL